jgi:site-specific recombinase XerD
MEKISFRFVYNRKHQLNRQGMALLQIEAYCRGQKVYFTTHIYLRPVQWDNHRSRIRRHPNAVMLNLQVRKQMAELEEKEITLRLAGQAVTPASLKHMLHTAASVPFFTFVEQTVKKVSRRASTCRNRLSTLHVLQRFRPTTDWAMLDHAYVDDLVHYLRGAGCRTSTIGKHLKHLRLFLNLAIRRGYLQEERSPFRTYSIPSTQHVPVYLTLNELTRLETLYAEGCPPIHLPALEAYLFCCYTGLRYSDFISLSASCFVYDDSITWLQYTSIKTETAVKLPLDHLFEGKALQIYWSHSSCPEELFRLKSNKDVNQHLVSIAELAHISKHLTFHTARHTFATLLIYKGASILTVQKLLGHHRITTTEHYGEVLPQSIINDLKRCE